MSLFRSVAALLSLFVVLMVQAMRAFVPEVRVPHGSSEGTLKSGIMGKALINGGAAGNHTVTGIGTEDELVMVLHHTPGAAMADLTSEFSITAADTINNAGGTATTSDQLLVLWIDKS